MIRAVLTRGLTDDELIVLNYAYRAVPRVTIGIPTYNGARTLARAIDSVLAQTFTDVEIIVSDNASTDESEAICNRYGPKIRYYRHPATVNSYDNFAFTLAQARTPYFMFL